MAANIPKLHHRHPVHYPAKILARFISCCISACKEERITPWHIRQFTDDVEPGHPAKIWSLHYSDKIRNLFLSISLENFCLARHKLGSITNLRDLGGSDSPFIKHKLKPTMAASLRSLCER